MCVCAAGEQIRKRRCKAAFSYVPQHEDELELKIGDVIEIIAEVRLKKLKKHFTGFTVVIFMTNFKIVWQKSAGRTHEQTNQHIYLLKRGHSVDKFIYWPQ